jgi:hypothetical protein
LIIGDHFSISATSPHLNRRAGRPAKDAFFSPMRLQFNAAQLARRGEGLRDAGDRIRLAETQGDDRMA